MSLVQPSGSDKLLHILYSPHIRTAVQHYAGTHRVRLHCVHSYTPLNFLSYQGRQKFDREKPAASEVFNDLLPELGILHFSIGCADDRLVKSGIDCSLLPVCYSVPLPAAGGPNAD